MPRSVNDNRRAREVLAALAGLTAQIRDARREALVHVIRMREERRVLDEIALLERWLAL
jgi:hypothetical protein